VQNKYQKLLFSLAYFHSVLLERRKFRTLGLNIPYDFNDTDFKVSDDLLKSYLDAYAATPWDALKYLIAEANYGGRVTDELDRRVLASYLNKFYCEDALTVSNYLLSPLPTYYVPANGTLGSFKDYIHGLPTIDAPEAFGQHPNAEISYLIEDSKACLCSVTMCSVAHVACRQPPLEPQCPAARTVLFGACLRNSFLNLLCDHPLWATLQSSLRHGSRLADAHACSARPICSKHDTTELETAAPTAGGPRLTARPAASHCRCSRRHEQGGSRRVHCH
jgi:hypothetical protein